MLLNDDKKIGIAEFMEINKNIDALTIINTPLIQEGERGEAISEKVNISQDLKTIWSTSTIMGVSMCFFAPNTFFGIGYLINKFNKGKAHMKLLVLYASTLFFDALLIYEIVIKRSSYFKNNLVGLGCIN
jgi:hypothetical protein